MSIQETIEISGVILGSLGGGVAIVFGFSNWLGKVWAGRLMEKEKAEHALELESLRSRLTQDAESYKIKLKKSEFLFQKEYDAVSEFVTLKRSFLPIFMHPDMDWYEACDEIARDFNNIEALLNSFMAKHGAILDSDVKKLLSLSSGIAGANKFDANEQEISPYTNSCAEELFKKLDEAEERLLKQVHSQSST